MTLWSRFAVGFVWAVAAVGFPGSGAGQTVLISEIMADNGGTLLDEDGDSSDWIELYNPTVTPVDLDGWYLTDDAADLVKWQFPSTVIDSGGFLVLFASSKDRASVTNEELHTNFKLNASGEYLGLVRPDGVTVEDELSFSAQSEDVSFGYPFSVGQTNVLTDQGAECTAQVPVDDGDGTNWTTVGFDDGGWQSGITGVGYETGTGYAHLIGTDVTRMRYTNETVYVRVPFVVSNAATAVGLTLKMKYDDGFIAYINGVKVAASSTAPAVPAWNSAASGLHSDSLAVVFQDYDLADHLAALQSGTNVLALQGLNRGLDSSDLLILPKLEVMGSGGVIHSTPGLLAAPTPGAANAEVGYLDLVETPTAFPERGFYSDPLQVTLSNVTAGADIHYTLDGSEPTTNSLPYVGPIPIASTVNLRIRAFVEDWKPSPVRTDTYLFVDDVVLQPESESNVSGQVLVFGMDPEVVSETYYDASNQVVTVQDALKAIPTISIATHYDNLFGAAEGLYVNAAQRWERPASAELIFPDGTPGFHVNAGLRIRGGYSRHDGYEKHAFRLMFRNQYGAGKLKYPLFEDEGTDRFDKVDLRSAINYNWAHENSNRNTFLRDIFCRDAAGAMGQAYTRSRYYHLYLNGLYWGIYMTEERPVADFGASYFGGDSEDYDAVKNTSWVDPESYVVEATDGTLDAYNRLFAAAMAGFTNNADYFAAQGLDADGEPDPSLERLLDVENLIDFLLVIYYSGASDNGITKFLGGNVRINNLYAFYNRVNPDGFKWIQHDCEHALDTSTDLNRTGPFPHSNFTLAKYFNGQTLHEKLSVNEEYRIKFADRVYKHFKNGGAMVRTNCEARLDFRAAQIDRAIVANAARWGSTSLDRDTWVNAVATTRAFFSRSGDRCNEVIGYLDADGLIPSIDPPQMSRAGGLVDSGTTVSLNAAEGTIYCTTDGNDPRAIGGSVAGSSYAGSIPITRPTQVKARCRSSSGEWSALAQDTFWTPEVPLAISEVMYHAPDGNPHDFIELQNISDELVTLKGYQLDDGIRFNFKNAPRNVLGAGDCMVAVDDIDAFAATYGTLGIPIVGEYDGDLSNGGEEIDLEFKSHNLISFSYSDARDWPQAADGAGHSLVPLDSAMDNQETGSLDYGGNWRASTYVNGSPGYPDPVAGQTVVLNEIIAHTDTGLDPPYDSNDKIELYNPTASDVTLNGWYLSDDLGERTRWAIPVGTVVPAGGFVLFDENDFHPARTNGFGLDKAGEEVVLSAPDRVVDAFRFKGQENGASIGRYPDGAAHWLRTQPTPGFPNQLDELPIRISALMYNPPAPAGEPDGDRVEYIQLENRGTQPVNFDSVIGPWRIDGGVSYTFPAGSKLPAGERLWLVCFDPATDLESSNLFAATYGLDLGQETLLGPYAGQLSNRGERVAVERPQASDDPLDPLDTSWVVVDEVYYFDQSPWPSGADGTGYPLLRTDYAAWGVPSEGDTDADQLPDSWEVDHFGNLDQGNTDWDCDGFTNYDEYICDSDPKDSNSVFRVEGAAIAPTLAWTAVTGRVYTVHWSDDLDQPFAELAAGLTQGSYTDQVHSAHSPNFYRITVKLAP